jgi:hypothetical protein
MLMVTVSDKLQPSGRLSGLGHQPHVSSRCLFISMAWIVFVRQPVSIGRRGSQRDVVYLSSWPIAPLYMSPNKVWRSNSIFNLWLDVRKDTSNLRYSCCQDLILRVICCNCMLLFIVNLYSMMEAGSVPQQIRGARTYRARICKHLRSPGIKSEELIPLAYVVVPARQAGNRFLGSLLCLQNGLNTQQQNC